MRRRTHILLPTRNDDVRVTAGNRLCGKHDGFQPRAADFIDGHRRHAVGQTGFNHGLACGILPSASGEYLTQNHFVNRFTSHAGFCQKRLNHGCAQFWRRNFCQRAAEFTNRRAFRGDNYYLFHIDLTSLKIS